MKNDAIQRVSNAIAAQIALALPVIGGKSKVIVAPPNKDNVSATQIVLFPYRLMVNSALRNTERVLPPPDPQSPPLVYNDSLPLDVFYLLTAGTSQQDDLESLVWLGMAMQALQSNPNLVGPLVDGDTVRVSLEPAVLDEMSRVWAMFPDADYRTSVVYVASPVWIDPLDVEIAAPVIDDQRRFAQRAA
jgi:Pvc16 N-terminal domain